MLREERIQEPGFGIQKRLIVPLIFHFRPLFAVRISAFENPGLSWLPHRGKMLRNNAIRDDL
jgi:hypothetical protein